MNYAIHLATLISIYLILAQGFNIILGLGNLFNLAHIALYSIGAYCTAIGSLSLGLSFVECLTLSALVSSLCALLVGAISARLKNDYFAIGSLALASVISALEINWKELTNGVLGIAGIPRPVIGQQELIGNLDFLIFCLTVCCISLIVTAIFWASPFVRKLRSQAEFEDAASALGTDPGLVRNFAFFIGSFLAGLAGGLFAYFMSYIDPSSFALNEMVFVLTIVVVGRPGSFGGVCFSTIFFVLLPEALRFINIPSEILGPTRQLLYASILFSVVYLNRFRLFPVRREI